MDFVTDTTSRHVLLRWSPLLLWMLLIFVVSHQPSDTIPHYGVWDVLVKKGGHLLAYALLAIFFRWAGYTGKTSFTLAIAYAVSDELHQRHIPGRSGNIVDIFIDGTGALLALLVLYHVFFPWHKSRWAQTTATDEPPPLDV